MVVVVFISTNELSVCAVMWNSPAFGTTRRPPAWPKMPVVLCCPFPYELRGPLRVSRPFTRLSAVLQQSWVRSLGKVSAGALAWNSALSATLSETMKELWTLTLMSGNGSNSSLSVLSWKQRGVLYVRPTVRSGCIDELRSSGFPVKRERGHSHLKALV